MQLTELSFYHVYLVQWAMLFDGFMTETKWLSAGQVPDSEEYLRNGVVTSGVPLVFVHLLFMLGHDVSQNAAEFVDHIPPVISCPAKILRLWDDLGSAKVNTFFSPCQTCYSRPFNFFNIDNVVVFCTYIVWLLYLVYTLSMTYIFFHIYIILFLII